jgi:hypothetical protein
MQLYMLSNLMPVFMSDSLIYNLELVIGRCYFIGPDAVI